MAKKKHRKLSVKKVIFQPMINFDSLPDALISNGLNNNANPSKLSRIFSSVCLSCKSNCSNVFLGLNDFAESTGRLAVIGVLVFRVFTWDEMK